MMHDNLITRVCTWLERQDVGDICTTGIDGLVIACSPKPTRIKPALYHPLFCLVLSGSKEVYFGDQRVNLPAGESLIVSHDLPIRSSVTEATRQSPYLAMILRLDLSLLHNLNNELDESNFEEAPTRAFNAGYTDVAIIDVMTRLFNLVNRPSFEINVMLPLIMREAHFRLLVSAHGNVLRQLLQRGGRAKCIAKSITHIKQNFASPLTVSAMAEVAEMSPASFHKHFKTLTAMTPLQYQKELRLLEARRLLRDDGQTVTNAAMQVGYESPSQFSREYARMFGNPPRNDTMRAPP